MVGLLLARAAARPAPPKPPESITSSPLPALPAPACPRLPAAEAVKTVDCDKATGKPHTLWIAFAKLYERHGDLPNARIIFEKAAQVGSSLGLLVGTRQLRADRPLPKELPAQAGAQ